LGWSKEGRETLRKFKEKFHLIYTREEKLSPSNKRQIQDLRPGLLWHQSPCPYSIKYP
jgi:hypothetical protein